MPIEQPVTLFYSYAHEDEPLRQQLEMHLSLLQRQDLISPWHDREIGAGSQWGKEIDDHLNAASIILLLISPGFLASDYCYDIEMQRALERHRRGEARVLPILLRPCDWQNAPFGHLQIMPRGGKAVTEWENIDIAFREITKDIRHAIAQLRGIPAQKQHAAFSPSGRTHRQRLLKRVHANWISGVLDQSLHQAARIELGLQEQPDALANPWHLTLQEMNQEARPLPAGTHITQIYDAADGELLILGEPGAGKTTLLLELARDLLRRAEEDKDYPMPVVFNLSSWVIKRQPLVTWMIEELVTKYRFSHKVAASWINDNQVIILLDGLDEVASKARSACLDIINAYLLAHELSSLVVCSRSVEYFAQTKRLCFQQAITIQPLTFEQVEMYLSQMGEQVEAVHQMLQDDLWLQESITTPLMLIIFIFAYQGKSIQGLPPAVPLSRDRFEKATTELQAAYNRLLDAQPTTQEARQASIAVQAASEQLLLVGRFAARRRHLFATYTERVLHRRGSRAYTPQQTIHWLSWLAQTMLINDQTIFSMRIQLKKLPNPPLRIYRLHVLPLKFLFFVLIGVTIVVLISAASGLVSGLVGGVISLLLTLLQSYRGGWGGNAITTLSLRFYLYRAGSTPWNYSRFLDYAAGRILLRKVGHDYIFVHRLLLDYFASLEHTDL